MAADDYLPVRTDDIESWDDDQLNAAANLAAMMLEDDDWRKEQNFDPDSREYRPVLDPFRRRLVERRLDAMCAETVRRLHVPA